MDYESRIKEFNSTMLSFDLVSAETCEKLTQLIIESEQKILSFGHGNYPKAPSNTITTRHQYYNLLDFGWEELDEVKQSILKVASQVIGGDSFYVKMWANIFRQGENIDLHIHHGEPVIENETFKKNIFKTICGNLFLSGDKHSDTIYYFNGQRTEFPNKSGDVHYFSCVVPHETLPYKGELRVGLAFDIYTEDFFQGIGMQTPKDLKLVK
jgi:hypothetical protein